MGGRWLFRVIVCNVDIGSKVTNFVMGFPIAIISDVPPSLGYIPFFSWSGPRGGGVMEVGTYMADSDILSGVFGLPCFGYSCS